MQERYDKEIQSIREEVATFMRRFGQHEEDELKEASINPTRLLGTESKKKLTPAP